MIPLPLRTRAALALASVALPVSISGCDDPTSSGGGQAPRAVEISAPVREFEERDTVELEVRVTGSGGATLPDSEVSWSSSNPTVATVSGGRVTGWFPGSAVITASAGSAGDTVTLTVVAAVASLEVEDEELVIVTGSTERVGVRALDRRGEVIARPALRWSSADSTVVTVEDSVLRGVNPGRTRVSVEAGAVRREIVVEVRAAYALTLLATLGGAEVLPADVNDLGQVIGWATAPLVPGDYWERRVNVLWRGGTVERLSFDPAAINDRGEILVRGLGPLRVWRDGQIVTVLPVPPDDSAGTHVFEATALNDAGEVAGILRTTRHHEGGWTVRYTAIVYAGGTLRTLPEFDGRMLSVRQMNQRGDLAGVAGEDGQGRTFVWRSGSDPKLVSPGQVSYPEDLNEGGDLVGHVSGRASLHRGDRTIDLGALPGESYSYAYGVNDRGEVVGTSGHNGRGFLWRDGRMFDLDDLVASPEWRVAGAYGINDRGVIVVVVVNRATGAQRAALLTPPS